MNVQLASVYMNVQLASVRALRSRKQAKNLNMEFGDKLSELNMTTDEIDTLTKAFKDEKFREMLRNYAQEISDPENKKKYEEEIKLLERERGNNIEFIHPKPFKALKTSVDGKQKCFINICGNEKVGKPECKYGASEDGRTGQCWALPHSMHPGRQETDTRGNKIMIYDVVFHPDTLHIASKSKKFMDMVDKTAIQGIQNSFKVTLDEKNIKEMSTKYKGTLQPCVIRKPIPGYKAKELSDKNDPLTFPYPDEKKPATSWQNKPAQSTAAKNDDSNPEGFQLQLQKSKEPTKPNYSIKYRSIIDLQDFTCSRDSAKGPRPKDIVVTIDLPLLKSVTDASLEAKEKSLLLETKKPSYRLELPLAYPVDENKGEAKFNKHTGQLIVTLPVLPSDKAFDMTMRPAKTLSDVQSVIDGERQENGGELEEEICKEKEKESNSTEDENIREKERVEVENLRQQTKVKKSDDNDTDRDQENGYRWMRTRQEMVEDKGHVVGEIRTSRKQNKRVEEERGVEKQKNDRTNESEQKEEQKVKKQKQEDGEQVGKCELQKRQDENHDKTFSNKNLGEDGYDRAAERKEQETKTGCTEDEGKKHLDSFHTETQGKKATLHATLEGEKDVAFQNNTSSEESQAAVAAASASVLIPTTGSSHVVRDCCISQGGEECYSPPVTVQVKPSKAGSLGEGNGLLTEDLTMGSAKQEGTKHIDEDDLPTEQEDKPSTAVLREIDEDGNEKIISDHSTSAGIIFKNTLIYHLD